MGGEIFVFICLNTRKNVDVSVAVRVRLLPGLHKGLCWEDFLLFIRLEVLELLLGVDLGLGLDAGVAHNRALDGLLARDEGLHVLRVVQLERVSRYLNVALLLLQAPA